MLVMKKVQDLKPGDMVDLQGDIIADFDREKPAYEFEFSVVEEVKSDPTCVLVTFADELIGFPPDHLVRVEEASSSDRSDHLAWDDDDVEHHND